MADEKKSYLIDIKSNYQQYIDNLIKAKKALDEMTEARKRLDDGEKHSQDEIEKTNAAYRNAQTEVKNATKLVDIAAKANQAEAGSYEQLYRQWQLAQTQLKLLGNQYIVNDQGIRVLSEDYVRQSKVVADAKSSLDAFGKGVHDNRLNVGSYSEAIEGALGKFQAMPGPLGAAATATKSFGTALKALALNPVMLAITAVIGAVTGLIAIFKGFIPFAEKVERVIASIKAVFNVFKTAIISVVTGAESLGQAFGNMGDKIKQAAEEGAKWRQIQQDLFEMKTENAVLDAKEKRQIDELMIQSRNRARSETERMALIDQAVLKEEVALARRMKIADKEVEMAKSKMIAGRGLTDAEKKELDERGVAYANELKMRKNLTEDDIQAYSDALVNQQQVLNASLNLQEKALARQDQLAEKAEAKREKAAADEEKRQEKLRSDMEKSKAALTKELEDYKAGIEDQKKLDQEAADDKKQKAIELAEWKKEKQLIDAENLLAIDEANNNNQFDIQRARLEQKRQAEVAAAEKTGADVNLINAKYSQARIEIDRLEAESKMALFGEFAGSIAEIFGRQTAIGKIAAVAQATVNTYLAASKALAAYPPPWSFIAMAAAIVAGIANVQKIVSVRSGLPGDSGGGSTPTASIPTSITSNPTAQRAFATPVGSSILTQPQLTQPQLNALPNQNIMTAADLTAALQKMPAPVVTVEDINARTSEVNKVKVRGTV